ncbi:MAG TPA: glycoside hydrolase family 97 N-terminal domain-containing protein, partial [Gemmatimonadaceae bacterium]|nr:glycoside hydrolase family 97 N-terminal domain-containing protein [Gemmatimonadaceae bacterium]
MHTGIRCINRSQVLATICVALAGSAVPAISQDRQGPAGLRLASPDGRNVVTVDVREGFLYYTLQRDGRTIMLPSRLGFEFRGARTLRDSLRLVSSSRNTVDNTWTQPWGEVARVRDHHNELKVSVLETA